MAEGGIKFGREDPIDQGSYKKDEPDADTTSPFVPGVASTHYHRGEEMEMSTFSQEKSGQPDTSTDEMPFGGEETPLLGAEGEQERSWDSLTKVFPNASAINLETEYRKGQLNVKMKGFGKKLYKLFTKEKSTGRTRLNPELSKEIKDSLGPMVQDIIAEDRDTIKEQCQRLRVSNPT